MAVTIQPKNNLDFLLKFGIPVPAIVILKDAGVTLHLTFFDMLFMKDNFLLEKVTLSKDVNSIMKGTLDAETFKKIKKQVVNAVFEVTQKEIKNGSITLPYPAPDINEVVTITPIKIGEANILLKNHTTLPNNLMVPSDAGTTKELEKYVTGASPSFTAQPTLVELGSKVLPQYDMSPSTLIKSTPVALSEAQHLYQPVKGSSQGSRYFVIAINSNLKVAARIVGGDVGIRVEGAVNDLELSKLNTNGVTKKNTYFSGHFTCVSTTPERLIGAILLGCGILFDTPIPNLELIKNIQ